MTVIELLEKADIKTPCYVIDRAWLIRNLEILNKVERDTGCKILLAQKAFSAYWLYPLIAEYISGTTASGLYEARLGYEEMGAEFCKETHVFSPAYTESDFAELVQICDHISFNSYNQFEKFRNIGKASKGIRVNPEHSTCSHAMYDPCSPNSGLGATLNSIKDKDLSEIEGLHFHILCQQNAAPLAETLDVIIEKFGSLFKTAKNLQWVNMGGGHHITQEDYDIELLKKCIAKAKSAFGVSTVYLEPGEAVALNAGYLVTEVLDIIKVGTDNMIAITDASAACHMPDVLEMPYRPEIIGSCNHREHGGQYKYRLRGNTCLAGDIIGEYSFNEPLKIGSRLVFTDMAIYSMVKNNTFNGIPLPSIALLHENGYTETVKEFGYGDFKGRL